MEKKRTREELILGKRVKKKSYSRTPGLKAPNIDGSYKVSLKSTDMCLLDNKGIGLAKTNMNKNAEP